MLVMIPKDRSSFLLRQAQSRWSLPKTQKSSVSHPPTIYLIETVFESIRFTSAEQLSDINRHRIAGNLRGISLSRRGKAKPIKNRRSLSLLVFTSSACDSMALIWHVLVLIIIASSSSPLLYLNEGWERKTKCIAWTTANKRCRNRSILKKRTRTRKERARERLSAREQERRREREKVSLLIVFAFVYVCFFSNCRLKHQWNKSDDTTMCNLVNKVLLLLLLLFLSELPVTVLFCPTTPLLIIKDMFMIITLEYRTSTLIASSNRNWSQVKEALNKRWFALLVDRRETKGVVDVAADKKKLRLIHLRFYWCKSRAECPLSRGESLLLGGTTSPMKTCKKTGKHLRTGSNSFSRCA